MGFDEKLDISDMKRCAENFYMTLNRSIAIKQNPPVTGESDEEFDEVSWYRFARSAVIQVFEVTVEQSWKMMQRWVKINADNKIHEKPKRELFRTAHRSGLITDPVQWWSFYEGRNKTEEVYNLAKGFANPLRDFVKRLEERA